MDEKRTHSKPPGRPWPDWYFLALLLLLTTGMRVWQVCQAQVVSRDTPAYIRVAWQLERGNTQQVLHNAAHHPGYPITVLAMSWLVRPLAGDDLVWAMQLSARLASALAGTLLVIPMFFLGRDLFDRRIGFWGALLFQCLPACSRVLADGLSESLFLLCAATSLCCATRSLRTGSLVGLALSGLAGALAYLTRPEGAALVVAVALALLLMQAFRQWRCTWGRFGLRMASLWVPALCLALPYMVVIGHFTVKLSARLISWELSSLESTLDPEPLGVRPLTVTAQPLGVWEIDSPAYSNRLVWSLCVTGSVLLRAFFYVWCVPLVIGIWSFRERFLRSPGAWALSLTNLAVLAALFRVTLTLGYVSERHLLLVVMSLSYWAVAGMDVVGRHLAWRFAPKPLSSPTAGPPSSGRRSATERLGAPNVSSGGGGEYPSPTAPSRRPQLPPGRWATPQHWSLVLLLVLTAAPLAKTLTPLHDSHLSYRTAGYWMAQNTDPDDAFYDPFGWTYYYAGRVFHEPIPGRTTSPITPLRYVLQEDAANKHPHIPEVKQAASLIEKGHGEVVHTWNLPKGKINLYKVTLPDDSRQ